ncbi:MAG: RelA/SpoT family protein [Flavobacteriales bacterium CG_4_8_14_3_um_filter_35_10]|nr:bifunctional (p)ppGpp synthetase/guanosine-3',5'-bis(diphosphate) 3'-pyrophosphohydrolase [Zetaproteobacteria bacterium]PIX07217.1 MAG: RelA/SpoT family protein [Flavobacteriales bacterium CG_4_8_14_3_um_filter_35_10]PJA05577.1 MAG: RelA/SpoT family protein [Flavobacteriales bacterium CG_4_10_14_0_2_um_filter_35_18]
MAYLATLEEEKAAIALAYKNMLKDTYQTLSSNDKKLIRKAFDLAADAHKEQRRRSGEPYIFHPIAVAKIVANDIGLGATSIAAALLHDVVEDTSYKLSDIEELFGETIARIVNGLTKIAHLQKDKNDSIQSENFRKMLLTLNDDVRVIIIKIADRLHNMQTMEYMPADKQEKIASETLYIYAPLAHRLGLYNIKTELEDLGLKYTEPEIYNDIVTKIEDSKEVQDAYILNFTNKVKSVLDDNGFKYRILSRTKSIFSIRRKMLNQDVSFDEVYDKFAIRIIYKSTQKNEKFDAWKIYSIITENFSPNPSRLRDWISQPKSNGYESLHITVMGDAGKWIEVQIRSDRMDEIAEKGYAAHYKYKHQNESESGLEIWLNKLKEILESPDLNAVDFVEQFKLNLYAKEIYIFTPKGQIKSLPKGATALDFAFSIHTEIGMKCRGVKVNGKLVPISKVLNSGDQVEIITSINQTPKLSWLDFVITARAKSKIKNALKQEQKIIGDEGKELLTRKLRHLKITLSETIINELVTYFKLKTSLDLFYRVGNGAIENKQLKAFASQHHNSFYNFFKNKIRRKNIKIEPVQNTDELSSKYDLLVFGDDAERLNYSLSKCCNPIPGDKVFGFVTINEGIKVHKKDCPNAVSLQARYAYRIISATWIDSTQQEFKSTILITGVDNKGLANKVTRVISDNMNIDIQSLNITGNLGRFEGKIAIKIKNIEQLNKLIERIKKIEGIEKVSRILN